MRRLIGGIVFGLATLAFANVANAALVLQLSSGGNTVQISDNGGCTVVSGAAVCGGDLDVNAGSITALNVALGGFAITVTSTNTTGSDANAAILTTTDTTIANVSGGAGASLEIIALNTGYTQPVGSLLTIAQTGSATGVAGAGSVDFNSYGSSPSQPFALGVAIAPAGTDTGVINCSGAGAGLYSCSTAVTSDFFAFAGADFSLLNQTVVTLAAGAQVSTAVSTTATVPEPGSMALLGSGLFALAGAIRRRRAKK